MTIETINGVTWMDTEDLAAIAGWKKNTVEGRRSRGEDLPPDYPFGRRVRYKLSDVEAWIESKRRVPSSVRIAEAETA
jgi:predicted DNA-binding transcriptional regulator AlpA